MREFPVCGNKVDHSRGPRTVWKIRGPETPMRPAEGSTGRTGILSFAGSAPGCTQLRIEARRHGTLVSVSEAVLLPGLVSAAYVTATLLVMVPLVGAVGGTVPVSV